MGGRLNWRPSTKAGRSSMAPRASGIQAPASKNGCGGIYNSIGSEVIQSPRFGANLYEVPEIGGNVGPHSANRLDSHATVAMVAPSMEARLQGRRSSFTFDMVLGPVEGKEGRVRYTDAITIGPTVSTDY